MVAKGSRFRQGSGLLALADYVMTSTYQVYTWYVIYLVRIIISYGTMTTIVDVSCCRSTSYCCCCVTCNEGVRETPRRLRYQVLVLIPHTWYEAYAGGLYQATGTWLHRTGACVPVRAINLNVCRSSTQGIHDMAKHVVGDDARWAASRA